MKIIPGLAGAALIATALVATPADARPRCVWQGHAWRCWNGPAPHAARDRAHMRRKHAEIKRDRRHLRHLKAELRRDVHSGSSSEIRQDRRALNHARRELREDRRDLRQLRWGE
jgi:hypothetical protein